MTGIITVGIAAILAWPQTDQHAAQQVVTDQNTLQVAQSLVSEPVSPNGEPSSYEEVAFAMETEREQEMEPVSPPLEFRIEKKPMAETSEPLQTPDEFTLNGRSTFEESSPIVEEEKKYEEAQEVLSQVETPKAVLVSSHQIELYADGTTADWNTTIAKAKENGVQIVVCKLKRDRKGVVKKIDMSVQAKRPGSINSYRGFLRINSNDFESLKLNWNLDENGGVQDFEYSTNSAVMEPIDNVYSSCSKIKIHK